MLCLLAAAVTTSCGTNEPKRPAPQVMSLHGADGRAFEATLFKPDASTRDLPGVVAYALSKRSAEAFEAFAAQAASRGYAVLVLDLSHRIRGGGPRGAALVETAQGDLDAAFDALEAAGAPAPDWAVIGEDAAAHLALGYAAEHTAVQAAVLLSPGLELRGVASQPALEKFGRRPVLLMASLEDSLSLGAVQALEAAAQGLCEVRTYGGAAHGADLLLLSPRVAEQILLWLEPIFTPALQRDGAA